MSSYTKTNKYPLYKCYFMVYFEVKSCWFFNFAFHFFINKLDIWLPHINVILWYIIKLNLITKQCFVIKKWYFVLTKYSQFRSNSIMIYYSFLRNNISYIGDKKCPFRGTVRRRTFSIKNIYLFLKKINRLYKYKNKKVSQTFLFVCLFVFMPR